MTNSPYAGQNANILSFAPYSQEAEEAVIGAVLTNPEAFLGVASFLKAEDFYILRLGYIWEALTRITDRNDQIDFVTVQEELRAAERLNDIGGAAYLLQLINNTPTSVHAEVYGHLVERAAVRRRLLVAADEIKALALDEQLPIEKVTGESESRLFRVTERNLRRDLVPMREAINTYFDRIEHLMQHPDEPLGLPTGFRDLDELLGGLQRSDLLIFAGRPGMGKCVTGDTLIPTEFGLLPIEALKPSGEGNNDEEGGSFYPLEIGVQTPDGMKYTSHFYDSGIKPTLRLHTRAGYTLTGTYVHPVLVWTRSGKRIWKPLELLEQDDAIAVFEDGRIVWDELAHVEAAGMQHCYDLTVPDGHAFVGNGIVSHNTSFLLSVALNAAKLGARILIFTMEMGNDQIVQRFVSMETGINTQKLRTGQLTPQEWSRFVQATGRLGNLRIFIDDSPAITPIQMRTKCRRIAHEFGLDLVIVDYMQLMNAGGGYENNRVQEISYISRSLKELARELNVPLFSAAQLSRAVEQRQDKRPQLSDLRESGCLTGDTLIYMPDSGTYTPIKKLVGQQGFNVLSVNPETWKLERAQVSNAFCTGVKPVYKLTTRLGRTIRATGNHKFLTMQGWKRLDELAPNDHIALPRLEHLEFIAVPASLVVADPTPSPNSERGASSEAWLYKASKQEHSHVSDVYWDRIDAIEPDGKTEVFDLTVPGLSNFVANDCIVHNSIEQDADIVTFLYRDVVYNEATEFPNKADVIVAKHRNGPTGTIGLHFEKSLTKFSDARTTTIDLSGL